MNENKIGILTLSRTYLPDIGGIESHIKNIVDYSKDFKYKYNLYIICFAPIFYADNQKFEKEEQVENVFIKRLTFPNFGVKYLINKGTFFVKVLGIYMLPVFVFNLITFLIKNKKNIDIIHIQGAFPLIAGVFVGKIFRKKIIFSTHLMYKFHENIIYKYIFRFFINCCDKVLCVSDLSKEEMLKIGVKQNKLERFVSGINENDYNINTSKSQLRSNYEIEENDFVILFSSRLIEEKGLVILLDAFEKMRQYKDIKLIITGDGLMKENILEASKSNQNIKYLGVLYGNQNIEKFFISDLLIFPTIYKGEATPLILREALIAELPIICSDIEVIRENYDINYLHLIEPNIDNVINSILFYYKNRDTLELKKVGMKEYALNSFGKNTIKHILDVYDSLILKK